MKLNPRVGPGRAARGRSGTRFPIVASLAFSAGLALATAAAPPVPEKIACAVADRQDARDAEAVRLTGWLGSRIAANATHRLATIDPDRLLEGYRKRPGRQSWDGEHVGKWLHAATLAWVNTGDPALRAKLDRVVAGLSECQLADGYLGTYLEKDRWTDWDVWAHKYNLIGLIAYMRATGNLDPLPVCRRMADLLCETFGDAPGQRDLIKAGHHAGMAPTSVLEPMVQLYRLTGEPRYLEFCRYILRAWEQPNGPKIVSTLRSAKRVDKVGNAKAYEMLSCLNGALEYYRTVGGDRDILDACLNAWVDIVDRRLYLTGASSYRELFHGDFDLPNTNNVGETCVTVTWLQFNVHLLRLTGEARFAEQLERVVLNQLLGAQRPDGAAWGYYVQMEGQKPYRESLDGHCCLSSGPRGIALIPTFAAAVDADGAVVNLYDAGKAALVLRDGTAVSLGIETLFPAAGAVRISVTPAAAASFSVKLRLPAWSRGTAIRVNGEPVGIAQGADGYAALRRTWKPGDRIDLALKLEPRVIVGDHSNAGKAAVMYGPLVLAADAALLPAPAQGLKAIRLAGTDPAGLGFTPEPAAGAFRTWPGAQVFRVAATTRTGQAQEIRLVPFADAGATGSTYKVWLPLQGAPIEGNLLGEGAESRSRPGNLDGSINDGDPGSAVVTYDGRPAKEDWYAVALDAPATIRRVAFVHGRTLHDGGWFDASAGPPRVQVQRTKDGAWETLGALRDYPAATASDSAGLRPGQTFTLTLAEAVTVVAVRVTGTPACGDTPRQAFSSCAELQAF